VKPKASEGEMSYEPAGDLRHDGRAYWPAQAGVGGAEPLPEEMGGRHQDRMEDLLAPHARHFPQLRQALATLDADYVRRKALGDIERHLHQERRRIVGSFLSGLAKDFGRLERLMRVVREMSPAEPWIHQFQRAGRRCGVEMWRGGLGAAYLLPALSSAGASLASPCFRFHIPLIEPDVRICRIRLSEKTHTIAVAIACDAVRNF
jgi:hypothetical protein